MPVLYFNDMLLILIKKAHDCKYSQYLEKLCARLCSNTSKAQPLCHRRCFLWCSPHVNMVLMHWIKRSPSILWFSGCIVSLKMEGLLFHSFDNIRSGWKRDCILYTRLRPEREGDFTHTERHSPEHALYVCTHYISYLLIHRHTQTYTGTATLTHIHSAWTKSFAKSKGLKEADPDTALLIQS